MSQERKDLVIKSFGAEIQCRSREEGGFLGRIALAEAFARATPDVFLPRQFENDANAQAHSARTGPEIWWQLEPRANWSPTRSSPASAPGAR